MPKQIPMEQAELDALNVLTSQAVNTQAVLQKSIAGRNSFLTLLEKKYDGVFDETTGKMMSKDEPKTKEDKSKK
jgi:hypothetical protein